MISPLISTIRARALNTLDFAPMSANPFTVALIQQAVPDDPVATLRDAESRIRGAATRGAQVILLQELFNSRYFATAQKGERFDIAEPIPGPTVSAMQALAKELALVIVVPIFERQAAGVYRSSA